MPESLKSPVVLCYLEEMSYEAAARCLGVTEGTIRGRLVRARDLLRARLARKSEMTPERLPYERSFELKRPRRTLPPALIAATTRAAMRTATDRLGTTCVPAAVNALVHGAMTMMFVTRLKIAAAAIAALGLAAAAALATKASGIEPHVFPIRSTPLRPGAIAGASEKAQVASPDLLEDRSPAAVSGGATVVASDERSIRKRMTLEEAIERYLRECAPQSAALEIPAAESERLTSLLRFDRSTVSPAEFRSPARTRTARAVIQSTDVVKAAPGLEPADRRQVRIETARPRRIVEAMYQDAVRNQIDGICKTFVEVEATQEMLHRSRANLARWEQLLGSTQTLVENGTKTTSDVDRIRTARDAAESKWDEAIHAHRQAQGSLGLLLNMSVNERETLAVASRFKRLRSAVLPGLDELVPLALQVRPDLAALRLGEQRAGADLARAQAVSTPNVNDRVKSNRQVNVSETSGQGSSDAKGVIVPIVNQRDGSIARAKINLHQSQFQRASMERQVTLEVKRTHLDCEMLLNELSRTEGGILAEAARLRDATERDHLAASPPGALQGPSRLTALLLDWSEYEKVERRYVDILARYLGNALELNTAVGERIMP